ncbi:glycosyltransferase family 8 C-terminal domain-containing protein [Providencia hangzhouensis]
MALLGCRLSRRVKHSRLLLNTSPWRDCQLVQAKKKPEYQERYKHEFHQGKFISGIKSLFKYKRFK